MGLENLAGVYRRVSWRMAWLTFFHFYHLIFAFGVGYSLCTENLKSSSFILMSLVDSDHWLFRKHKREEHACVEARLGRRCPSWSPSVGRASTLNPQLVEAFLALVSPFLDGRMPSSSCSQVQASALQLHGKQQFCLRSFWDWKVSFLLQRGAFPHLKMLHRVILFAAVKAVVSPAVPPFDQHNNWTCFVFIYSDSISKYLRPDQYYIWFSSLLWRQFSCYFPWFWVMFAQISFSFVKELNTNWPYDDIHTLCCQSFKSTISDRKSVV